MLNDLYRSSFPGKTRGIGAPSKAILKGSVDRDILLLDTISEEGPKLIQASDETVNYINSDKTPLRAIQVVHYHLPEPLMESFHESAPSELASRQINIFVKEAGSNKPIPGIRVVALTDVNRPEGEIGFSDSKGRLSLIIKDKPLASIQVSPSPGYWGSSRTGLGLEENITVLLEPISLEQKDVIRTIYGQSSFDPSTRVKVAVIDSGVGPHDHLNVIHGANMVTEEKGNDFRDFMGHGTHVAGLIGANSRPPEGLRGMAPNVGILAYRVFGKKSSVATNYAILKSIIDANYQACDIINLSLGGAQEDEIVAEAIKDAKNKGMIIVAAAGNDHRNSVSYPAAYPEALAVSAMGIEDTFPHNSLAKTYINRPPQSKKNKKAFMASFSNVGMGINMVGLGVGTVSTLPNQQYGPLSGTSMAAPMVSGAIACLLSKEKTIFNMPRNSSRADAIEKLILSNCVKFGFGMEYEGYGLPDPDLI
ncbi:MAG: S8 family serine peptidase [Bacteroidota bacterium]